MYLFKIWEKSAGRCFLIGIMFCLLSNDTFAQSDSTSIVSVFTPIVWQQEGFVPWNRDVNPMNGVDDIIDSLIQEDYTLRIPVVIDLRKCLTKSEIRSRLNDYTQEAEFIEIGTFISYVYVDKINPSDALKIASLQDIAMVEYAGVFRAGDIISKTTIKADPSSIGTLGYDGTGVNVAIMDSGVDTLHEALVEKFIAGYNAITDSDTDLDDISGHGTHVAATILGNDLTGLITNSNLCGIAPGAGLINVKVLGADPMDDCFSMGPINNDWLYVSRGLNWILEKKDSLQIDVVNMSFSQQANFLSVGDDLRTNGLDAMSQLVNYASGLGLVMVGISGNEGGGVCQVWQHLVLPQVRLLLLLLIFQVM